MSVEKLSHTQEISVANNLKELYYLSVIEGQFQDDSDFFHNIKSLVDQSIKSQNEATALAGGDSLRFPTTRELANAFWGRYRNCILATEEFSYKINNRFGYTIDLANVIAPYFLYQAGVTDATYSFYIGLGLTVANIICDSLASQKETRDEAMNDKRIRTICNELTKYLIISKASADVKYQDTINKSIEELGKIASIKDNN